MDLAALLAPSRCLICGLAGRACCAACRSRLVLLRAPLCARCGRPTAHVVTRCRECAGSRLAFAGARAAVALDGAAAVLVHRWKDGGLRSAGVVALDVLLTAIAAPTADRIVPVPAVGDRARRRGVDGPRRLADGVSAAWAIPCEPRALRRTSGRPQRGLSRQARRLNARTSFALGPAALPPQARVVLVDDVYTTGATADACSRLLRAAGAQQVDVVTFARVVR
jgi:ComF family protein